MLILTPILGRLDRAVERLKELSDALTQYERVHRWSPGDESLDTTTISFDNSHGLSVEPPVATH